MKKYITPLNIVIAAVIVAAGALVYGFGIYSKPTLSSSLQAKRMDLTEEISVSGTVKAAQDVSLSFERGGRVVSLVGDVGTKVYKGQTIASVSSSDLLAELRQAQIALETQQLKLNNLQPTGASSSVQVSISNARSSLLTQFRSGYVNVDTALSTNIDPLFSSPRTTPFYGVTITQGNSVYSINAPYALSTQINNERQSVNVQMKTLDTLIAKAQASQSDADITLMESSAISTITSIQKMITDISSALSSYSGQDSTVITIYNGYRNQISIAQTTINNAQIAVQNAINAYTSSQTPVSTYDVSLQQAGVQSAQAQIDAIRTQIGEGSLRSPIDGVITEEDIKVGETVGINTPVIHVISNGKFQIESYVSEADINLVKVGDPASITLTAQGQASSSYAATVASVDPAETTVNGVGSYKVTLQFDKEDASIKSGMTANVNFIVGSKSNVLAVPQSAVISQNGKSYVLIPSGKQIAQHEVVTGIRSGDGYIEIISGLNEGDAVIAFGTQNK